MGRKGNGFSLYLCYQFRFLFGKDAHTLDLSVLHHLVELSYILGLFGIGCLVVLGLLGCILIVTGYGLACGDISSVLVDIYLVDGSVGIGQIIGIYLVVPRLQLFDDFRAGQSVLVVHHRTVGVLPDGCFGVLPDEPVKNGLVPRCKVRVLMGAKHIPSAHARIALLVWVRLRVEGPDGAYIIGYQFFIAVGLHLVGVVLFVIHLLFLRAVGFQLGPPATDTYLRAFLHAVLLFAVLVLGTFFTRVPGVTPADQGENGTGLHQAVGKVTYQVVFHFQLGRDIHAVPVQGLEHVSHAVQKQLGSLVPVVGISYHSAAHHIIGIIGFHTVAILHRARQVAVIKAHLAQ